MPLIEYDSCSISNIQLNYDASKSFKRLRSRVLALEKTTMTKIVALSSLQEPLDAPMLCKQITSLLTQRKALVKLMRRIVLFNEGKFSTIDVVVQKSQLDRLVDVLHQDENDYKLFHSLINTQRLSRLLTLSPEIVNPFTQDCGDDSDDDTIADEDESKDKVMDPSTPFPSSEATPFNLETREKSQYQRKASRIAVKKQVSYLKPSTRFLVIFTILFLLLVSLFSLVVFSSLQIEPM